MRRQPAEADGASEVVVSPARDPRVRVTEYIGPIIVIGLVLWLGWWIIARAAQKVENQPPAPKPRLELQR